MSRNPIREALAWTLGIPAPEDITAERILAQMRVDGGIDCEEVSAKDIESLLSLAQPKRWSKVVFAAHELLSRYQASEVDLSREQVATAFFCAFVLGQAARANRAEFDSYNDAVIRILAALPDEHLTSSHIGSILNYAFARILKHD